ncbi:MBL fold metallo-hydrolase [Candidatus Lokiarchaeum ossiferum]|uniref:MBL fold metallo-hydrolase n=1 Tax=Candidatus Lokiarchaeum ossiferum TaxID=2951803 RepID=UPI00352EF018
MNIIFDQLNPHACKTYLFRMEGAKEAIIVDPLLDHLKSYDELLKKDNLHLTHILETHTHADHISGAAALKDITDAELIMHSSAPAKCPSTRVKHGDVLHINGIPIEIIETPGHTKDSVSYLIPGKILTGDALFLDDGGAGRDDLPGGDPGAHWESLQKFLHLPEDIIVYPAHDYRNREPSSLKRQKMTNPHLKPRTKSQFINYLTDLKLGPADWMKDVLKANYNCARDPQAAWIPVDSPACEIKGTMGKGVNDQLFSTIDPLTLKKRMDSNEKLVLLDVREPVELKTELKHIDGVENIPIVKLISNVDALDKHKQDDIVIICRSGGRASTAAQILKQVGFKNPIVLEGGMIAWRSIFGYK